MRVADFRASGQNAPAWCAEHDVNLHTLRYWLRNLSSDYPSKCATSVKWLSVEMAEEAQQAVSSCRIVVRIGDVSVEVEPGCDLVLLGDVVQTLVTRC